MLDIIYQMDCELNSQYPKEWKSTIQIYDNATPMIFKKNAKPL